MMELPQTPPRVAFGVALLLMVPAFLFVSLEAGARSVDRLFPAVADRMKSAEATLGGAVLTCPAEGADGAPSQLADATARLRSATWDLGIHAFDDERLTEATMRGLPLGEGFEGIRRATREFYATYELVERSKLCRDPDPEFGALVEEAEGRVASLREYGKKEEADALREAIRQARADRMKEPDGRSYAEAWKTEEARSKAVYAEIRGKLVEHQAALARAWEQFDRDRPKVAALAWTLGILEVLGWLAGLLILPGEIRTLRARWAAKREGGAER